MVFKTRLTQKSRTIKGVAKAEERSLRLYPWLNKPEATLDMLLARFQSLSEWVCILCLPLCSLERLRRVGIFLCMGKTQRC
jgi:hypothetical protein